MTPQDWLRDQCNRYVNGECHTTSCLVRGGYKRGTVPVDYSLAKCHAHETLQLITALEGEVSGLGDHIAQMEKQ